MSDPNKTKFLRYFFRKFPRAIQAVAEVSKLGDAKHNNATVRSYSGMENGHQEYSEAMIRHVFDEIMTGPIDPEDGKLHAARIAWAALARLEIQLEKEHGEPVDYQYEGGPIGEAIKSMYDSGGELSSAKETEEDIKNLVEKINGQKCGDPNCGCTTLKEKKNHE